MTGEKREFTDLSKGKGEKNGFGSTEKADFMPLPSDKSVK